jgi:ADP-heptose:LPS heptosyltransferase
MTGLNIQFYKFTTFIELCTIITSCKLFTGSLSAPLSIANAAHVPRICGHGINSAEINFNNGLDLIWDNFRYTV